MSFNPGSALTPSHDDPLEDRVLIRLTETAPARVASTSALEPPLRTGKSSAACVAVDIRGFFDKPPPLAARHVDHHGDAVHHAPAGDVPRQLAPALHGATGEP